MTIEIAHLGPTGTYTEAATLAYVKWLQKETGEDCLLCPYPTISQTLYSVALKQAKVAVVPVENSIQGSVVLTLDTLWELDNLKIQQAIILPVSHGLLSKSESLEQIKTVYSHPQALAQCQGWLEKFLPSVQLVATNSTTEALDYVKQDFTVAAIASQRAAQLYNLPIIASNINDYPDNCTKFWVLGLKGNNHGSYVSLGFSVPRNMPGSLVKPLQAFAKRNINLSRIESRPTKRSLGEYLFFIDLEGSASQKPMQDALAELSDYTSVLKIFGNYHLLPMESISF